MKYWRKAIIAAALSFIAPLSGCAVKLFNPKLSSSSTSASTNSGNGSPQSTPVTAIQLASHGYTTCAVTNNGAVECWGENAFGALGNGTTSPSASPVQVTGIASGATDVAVGYYHACAVASGGVKCWGWNKYGQLGNGTNTDSTTPVSVNLGGSTATRVVAGHYHSCALLTASPWVKCWGDNSWGQLGNGTTVASTTPVSLTPGAMPVSAAPTDISAGYQHTCVIEGSGTHGVWCWGDGVDGELGDNTSTTRTSPVRAGTLSNATSVYANELGSCAITGGTPYCWGNGSWGNFGVTGGGGSYATPTQAANHGTALTNVVSLAFGYGSGCAVLAGGGVSCWGTNEFGVQGNGSFAMSWDSATFSNTQLSGVSQLVSGKWHMCARMTSGAVKCWGNNQLGSVGTGSVTAGTPFTVSSLNTAVQVKGGATGLFCARLSNGDVYCWGTSWAGQLGDSIFAEESSTPTQVPRGAMGAATDIAVATNNVCAITNTPAAGSVWCWGSEASGMLGYAPTGGVNGPSQIPGISGAQKIFAGDSHACVILNATPWVKCWGNQSNCQLGNGAACTSFSATPVAASGFTAQPLDIGGTRFSTCVILNAAPWMKCWGYNVAGQLGNGSTTSTSTPAAVTAVSLSAAPLSISSAGYHAMCAVLSGGSMQCWGSNNNIDQYYTGTDYTLVNLGGQLGDGTLNSTGSGSAVSAGLPSAVAGASLVGGGAFHMCAIFNPGASGTVDCWGVNNYGQLGTTPSADSFNRVTVPGSGFLQVAGNDSTTCAVLNNNTVQCWGSNADGQLGRGALDSYNVPQSVNLF